MIKKSIFISLMIFIFVGVLACSKPTPKTNGEVYQYDGEVLSVVNQKGKEYDGINIEYTITLLGFMPKEPAFHVYNEQFASDMRERHIEVTKQTKIYRQNESKKEIRPDSIQRGTKVAISVRVVNDEVVEALEIIVLEEPKSTK